MFWFLLLSLVAVVAAVTLTVVGSGEGTGRPAVGGLRDAPPDLLDEPLPPERPVGRVDVEALRLPVALRGYHMRQVDDALDRLGAELAERDARIAELESQVAGLQAVAISGAVPAGDAAAGAAERAGRAWSGGGALRADAEPVEPAEPTGPGEERQEPSEGGPLDGRSDGPSDGPQRGSRSEAPRRGPEEPEGGVDG